LAVGVLAVLVLAVGVATAALGGGKQRYETEGFSFEHPTGWESIEDVSFPALEQAVGDTPAGEDVVGIDGENWVSVFTVGAGAVVDAGKVRELVGVYATGLRAVVAGTPEARLLQEPFSLEKGGLPGLRYRVSAPSLQGSRVTDTVTVLFRGSQQLVITCQARPEHALSIAEGCEQVLETLEPGKA
jgi:hypothetical protein